MTPRAIIAGLALIGVSVGVADAADWKGSTKTIDGVPHVMNGAAPASAATEISPRPTWKVGGETDNDDEFFAMIIDIVVGDDNNVYLLDQQMHEVVVFTMQGEFVRRIGRDGEGPGEFRNPLALFKLPDGNVGVLQPAPARVVMLTPDGIPAGDFPLPEKDGSHGFVVGGAHTPEGLVLSVHQMLRNDGGMSLNKALVGVDKSGQQVAQYIERKQEIRGGVIMMDSSVEPVWAVGETSGRVYINDQRDEYQIKVFDPTGNLLHVIHREYDRPKRGKKEMAELTEQYQEFPPDQRPKVDPYLPAINDIHPQADGSVWVLASDDGAAEGTFGRFDVFDPEGRFVGQVVLKCGHSLETDGVQFIGDRMFVIADRGDVMISIGGPGPGGGGGGDSDDMGDADPVSVLCYPLQTPQWN